MCLVDVQVADPYSIEPLVEGIFTLQAPFAAQANFPTLLHHPHIQ